MFWYDVYLLFHNLLRSGSDKLALSSPHSLSPKAIEKAEAEMKEAEGKRADELAEYKKNEAAAQRYPRRDTKDAAPRKGVPGLC